LFMRPSSIPPLPGMFRTLLFLSILKNCRGSSFHGPYNYSECGHGWRVPGRRPLGGYTCTCDEANRWKLSGPTDIYNFMDGKCEQYMCVSDEMCQRLLNIPGATCDVKDWNCVCGWAYATNFFGGFENDRAKCMGMMYLASDNIVTFSIWLLRFAWTPFAFLMAVCLGCGEKKIRCDCSNPTRFKVVWGLKEKIYPRGRSQCRGECMSRQSYRFWEQWHHEFAWSLYFLDIAIWSYAMVIVILCTGVVVGSIVALAILAVIVMISLIMCLMGVAGEGGGNVGGDGGGICNCDLGNADCTGCENCCSSMSYDPMLNDQFFWGGPQPLDCSNCYCGDSDSSTCCSCLPRCWLCRPLAWVLIRFPEMPANFWGGLSGRFLGTHQFSSRPYVGQHHPYVNRIIDRLSLRTAGDNLHRNSGWRDRVREYILSDSTPGGGQASMAPPQQATMQAQRRQDAHRLVPRGITINEKDEPFDKDRDNCEESTFEDYVQGTCWVCQNEEEKWDKWVLCGHLFCSMCSSTMLARHMPCPLCRRFSTTVVRAPAPAQAGGYQPPPATEAGASA